MALMFSIKSFVSPKDYSRNYRNNPEVNKFEEADASVQFFGYPDSTRLGLFLLLDYLWNRQIDLKKENRSAWLFVDPVDFLFDTDQEAAFLIDYMPHMHYVKCEHCGKYAIGEDESKLLLKCEYENSLCRVCKRPCNHDKCEGMRQIEGTTEHAPICQKCGGVDIAYKAACWTDANGYEITETTHQKKCHDCGGVMEEIKSHLYTNYKPIIADDGTPVHSGKCECGAEDVSEHQYAEGSSVCSVCEYECTSHNWDSNTGKCMYCKVVCNHPFKDEDGACIKCGYHRDSTSGMFEKIPE